MSARNNRAIPILLLGTLLIVAAAVLFLFRKPPKKPDPLPARPASLPVTAPATKPAGPKLFVDLVRSAYPALTTTQPFAKQVHLRDAGHFLIGQPVHLDGRGSLWITMKDAEETATLLGHADDQQTIFTRERVLFVARTYNGKKNDIQLVVPAAGGNGFELISRTSRRPIGNGAGYDWERAIHLVGQVVVPTTTGASIFTLGDKLAENASPPLAAANEVHAPVELQFDMSGQPIAWIPPQKGHAGSNGAARLVNGQWKLLGAEAGWPKGIIHIVPLADGSIMQILADANDSIKLSIVAVDSAANEKEINALIDQLSDFDPTIREKAYAQLTRYGPGLWPIAEKRMPKESAEARSRLRMLLRARITPRLGDMRLAENKLRVVSRHPDGGALLYSYKGVLIPRPEDEEEQTPTVVAPAWISIRPGYPIQPLPAEMIQDFDPDKSTITRWGDEWIGANEVLGPRRYIIGSDWLVLTRKSERAFSRFVGIDLLGRYLLRNPADSRTLIIDPSLPDPIPRLPVWNVFADAAGWNKDDHPAIKNMGTLGSLRLGDWQNIDEKTDTLRNKREQVPLPPVFTMPKIVPATAPGAATAPSSKPAAEFLQPGETMLLRDSAGNFYFEGRSALKVVRKDGSTLAWPLPPIATGNAEPWLIEAKDGILYLFNQPGRVLRIRPDFNRPPGASAAEPFVIEATFAKKIPNAPAPTRIWLDPLGRIVIAYEDRNLAILFPQGYVPAETLNLIPAGEQESLEEE